ncbi:hypothetical protein D1B32_03500 [Oceanobacillus profundus]|uniref:Uncharacterized protein n=1 Tax=Oceanobacillus profundus TaxID=372463 RepID=A0A417YLI1_9BACI|nr:hypothetical protein D1B32_03500 [Oceanobacillus profundus]
MNIIYNFRKSNNDFSHFISHFSFVFITIYPNHQPSPKVSDLDNRSIPKARLNLPMLSSIGQSLLLLK